MVVTPQGPERLFITQSYKGGTVCDLTQEPRAATAHFLCEPNLPENKWHIQVEESASCVYKVFVYTSLPCKHKAFLKETLTA